MDGTVLLSIPKTENNVWNQDISGILGERPGNADGWTPQAPAHRYRLSLSTRETLTIDLQNL